MPAFHDSPIQQRAVIVGGLRTPFLRAFGAFTKMDAIALSAAVTRRLIDHLGVKDAEIGGVYWGGVILPGGAPNVAREIVIDAELPRTIEGTTFTRACTSGIVSITQAAAAIERGEVDCLIAGGADSTSNAEVKMPQSFVHKAAPVLMSGKAGVGDYFKLLGQISLKNDLIPQRPAIQERSTGELMGESAERMAEYWGITREEQDAFAAQSHHRAAAAFDHGSLSDEVIRVHTPDGDTVETDNLLRPDTSVEKMAKLKPAFKEGGTLTAANSSALTDGAAAVMLMSEEKAKALGLEPLAAFRSWSYDAVDPADQLLIGPAISMPRALRRAGMALGDASVVDIHEAFAAQVLCVLKAMASDEFAKERLGWDQAPGELKPEDINIHGGSVALGHPFAATGARMVTTMAHELKRSGKETALLGICAAGGQSAGAVLEAV